jgi:hypothetical protein
MVEAKRFFGGVPVEPDVKALRDAFGVPKVGQTITDAQVEKITRLDRKEVRYRTVTGQWRKAVLRECNLRVARRGGQFIVLSQLERMDEDHGKFDNVARAVGRVAVDVARIDTAEFDDVGKKRHGALRQWTNASAAALVDSRKALSAEIRATPLLPRPKAE